MSDHPSILVAREGEVATLLLNRPPLNILDLEMIAALSEELDRLSAEDSVHVVLLRGAGSKTFSAGVSVHDHTPDKVEDMLSGFHDVVRKLHAFEAVTVAAVDGHCLGGGMEMAMVCDLVVASERSVFAQPEIQLGCYPPVAAALYPALLGPARTHDLLFTGRQITAAQAELWGLLARCIAGDFEAGLRQVLAEVTSKSAAVLRLTKRAIRAGRERAFTAALEEAERIYLQDLARTHDMAEGIQSFLAKRPPVWRHE
jgi:cyclohexa-1,5-dienecarbonyl-CoA hydratase